MAGITEYRNFELAISADATGVFAQVINSPAGESARLPINLPFDPEKTVLRVENAILRSIKKVRSAGRLEADLREIGEGLFRSLMLETPQIQQLYTSCRTDVARDGARLRLRLRVDQDALSALPWEYFYDALVVQDFLGLHAQTSLVRYTSLSQTQKELSVDGPLRVLGMVANPRMGPGYVDLDVTNERNRIDAAIRNLHESGEIDFQWVFGESATDLYEALYLRGPWHAFHFIGHGGVDEENEGFVVMTKEGGEIHPIYGIELRRLLSIQPSLRLVVLNCCDSGRGPSSVAKSLVTGGVPAVLAMQYPISDPVAIEMSSGFYTALAGGESVDGALTGARIRMNLKSPTEWGIPVLYMRSPDGRIFSRRRSARTATAQSTREPVPAPTRGIVPPAWPAVRSRRDSGFEDLVEAADAREVELQTALLGDENLETWSPDRLAMLAQLGERQRSAQPGDEKLKKRLAAVYFLLCGHYRKDNANKAFISITTAIDLDPLEPNYLHARANLYARGDQFEQAMSDIDKAIGLSKDCAEFHWARGLICMLAGRTGMNPGFLSDAVSSFDTAIAHEPSTAKFFSSRGAAHHRLGNLDSALSDLARALELDAGDAKSYFNRARIRMQMGQLLEAEGDLQCALRLGHPMAIGELQKLASERGTRH